MKLSNKKKRKALKAVLKEHLSTIDVISSSLYSLCDDTEVCYQESTIDSHQYNFMKDLLKEEALKKGKRVTEWVWDSEDHESRTKWLKDQIKKLK